MNKIIQSFKIEQNTSLQEVINNLENIKDLSEIGALLKKDELEMLNKVLQQFRLPGSIDNKVINNSIKVCLIEIQRKRGESKEAKNSIADGVNGILTGNN